jgi:hypothetical protein
VTGDIKNSWTAPKPPIAGAPVTAHAADAFERSPIPNMDMPTFRNWLIRALSGDQDIPPSMLTRVNGAVHEHGSDARKRDMEWWENVFWQLAIQENLRVIDGLINRYNEMADWHHEQAEKAREKMREATDKLEAINQFIAGVNEVLDKKKDGKFDREKAIRLLKSRGVNVDPNEDDPTLKNRLAREQKIAQDEKPKWSRQYDNSKADADYHDTQEIEDRRKAEELIDRRDAIQQGGYGPGEKDRRLQQVTEEYKLDVQKKAAELEEQKNGLEQKQALDTTSQQSFNGSQTKQTQTEASDFEALAGALKGKFDTSAGKVVKEDPRPQPTVLNAPAIPGPGSPV